MKSKSLILGVATFFTLTSVQAQEQDGKPPSPTMPIETFIGNNYLNFQLIAAKPFQDGSRFGFFNVTNFSGDYDNNLQHNEFLSQALINYEIFKGLSVAAGATMNYMTGFRPTAGVQYLFANRYWLFVVLPRLDLRDDFNFETFAVLEYKPRLTDKLGLYTRVQGLYNHNTEQGFHDRSYLYLRVGLSIQNYQFGLGANFDRYGPFQVNGENYGLFVRIELK